MSTVPNFLDFIINAVLHPTIIRKLCYKLSSIVTFTFIQIFFIKIVPSLLNGIWVAAFAWYSVKIRVIFGVRSERRKVVLKKQTYMKTETCKLFLEFFEYFCQISSKFILTILSCTVSKLVHFSETQCTYFPIYLLAGDRPRSYSLRTVQGFTKSSKSRAESITEPEPWQTTVNSIDSCCVFCRLSEL